MTSVDSRYTPIIVTVGTEIHWYKWFTKGRLKTPIAVKFCPIIWDNHIC